MATTNISVTRYWTKVVDIGLDFTLTVNDSAFGAVEVAVSDTDVIPTVIGHTLKSSEESINRQLSGPGYIYMRSILAPSVIAVITHWTPA